MQLSKIARWEFLTQVKLLPNLVYFALDSSFFGFAFPPPRSFAAIFLIHRVAFSISLMDNHHVLLSLSCSSMLSLIKSFRSMGVFPMYSALPFMARFIFFSQEGHKYMHLSKCAQCGCRSSEKHRQYGQSPVKTYFVILFLP